MKSTIEHNLGGPLSGRRIIVTRSAGQAGAMAAILGAAGAEVLTMPTIRIEPPADPAPLLQAVRDIESFDWIIFTSTNAVEFFMERYRSEGPDIPLNVAVSVAAVGAATASALKGRSIGVDYQPEKFTGEELAGGLLADGRLRGRRVLLPRSDIAPRTILDLLTAEGAAAVDVPAYRNVPDETFRDDYNRLFEAGEADMITFTSSSTVENLIPLLSEKSRAYVRSGLACASIGPATSKTLRRLGISPAVEPAEHTVEGLAGAIIGYFAANGL